MSAKKNEEQKDSVSVEDIKLEEKSDKDSDQDKPMTVTVGRGTQMRRVISAAISRVKAVQPVTIKGFGRNQHRAVTLASIVRDRVGLLHQINSFVEEKVEKEGVERTYLGIQILLSSEPLDTEDPGYQKPKPRGSLMEAQPRRRPNTDRKRGKGSRDRDAKGKRKTSAAPAKPSDRKENAEADRKPRRRNSRSNKENKSGEAKQSAATKSALTEETAGNRKRERRPRQNKGGDKQEEKGKRENSNKKRDNSNKKRDNSNKKKEAATPEAKPRNRNRRPRGENEDQLEDKDAGQKYQSNREPRKDTRQDAQFDDRRQHRPPPGFNTQYPQDSYAMYYDRPHPQFRRPPYEQGLQDFPPRQFAGPRGRGGFGNNMPYPSRGRQSFAPRPPMGTRGSYGGRDNFADQNRSRPERGGGGYFQQQRKMPPREREDFHAE